MSGLGHRAAFGIAKSARTGYNKRLAWFGLGNASVSRIGHASQFTNPGPAKTRRDRVRGLIEKVGLTWARRRQLKEYSKGMARRIGLAQALINDPDLILLDEPTSGLDPIGVDEMKSMIMELKEQGKTVVMCSHLLTDVQNVCDRIAILHQGELKELGRVDSLLEVSDELQFRASGISPEAEKEIQAVIEKHNGKLVESGKPSTTLQELFLDIVSESEARPGRRVSRQD